MGVAASLGHGVDHGPINARKLEKELERAYATFNQTKHKTKTSFSPSTIGYGHGRCPRYWYIAFNGAEFEENADSNSLFNMQHGTVAHERITEIFKRSSLQIIDIEQEITNEYPPIRGFIDILLNRAGEEVVGEIKTTRTEAFLHRQSKNKPPMYHLIQLLIYMKLKGAKHGFFLYEDKNVGDLLVIPIAYDDYTDLIEVVWEWMEKVYDNWKDETLPERPWTRRKKECKACPVRAVCWDSLGEGEKDIEPLPV